MLNRKSVSKWKVLINSVGNKSVRKQLSLYWPVPSAKSASHWTLPARTVVHTDKNSRPHHPENMPRTEQLSSVSVLSHIWHRLYADSHAHITKTHKSQHPRAHIDADEMLLLPIPHSPRITKTITVSACWHDFFFPGIVVFSIHRLEAHSTRPANTGTDTGQLYSYQSCVFVCVWRAVVTKLSLLSPFPSSLALIMRLPDGRTGNIPRNNYCSNRLNARAGVCSAGGQKEVNSTFLILFISKSWNELWNLDI